MQFLIRLVQVHESFRKPELEALAALAGFDITFVAYSEDTNTMSESTMLAAMILPDRKSPFCIIDLDSEDAARALMSRSILSHGIYELWGAASDYNSLRADVRTRTEPRWPQYKTCSFRFTVDAYQGKRNPSAQRELIESFDYLGFDGPICMKDPDLEFCIFEEWKRGTPAPKMLYLGRYIAGSDRLARTTYDLKKRKYISTTSMDSELALVTANMAHAGPGKLFYDPFMGTGSLPIACAHFGAMTIGSDIDGRSIRGKKDRNVVSNFQQYGLLGKWMDGFISDLTHTPLRTARYLDGIVCDPPYGVREGLKVLGTKDGSGIEAVLVDGKPAHLQEGYIPPKRPYSFEAMLDDILDFAALMLVGNGRLSMWIPTANDEDVELAIPTHPCLEIVSVCMQAFNKWSRRLLTYRRLPDVEYGIADARTKSAYGNGNSADELNSFRRRYFQGFRTPTQEPSSQTS